MKSLLVALIGALCVTAAQSVSGEVLQGVEPLSTLGKIKTEFPNGRFERVRAAWVKESEAFYSMTGDGFPGKLYLAFDDERPRWRRELAETPPEPPEAPSADVEFTAELRRWLQGVIDQSDDEALTISWVRWVPPTPIPMERVKAKYGEPSKCDFDPSNFTPFCKWESRALMAMTSDDRKRVVFFTAQFTKSELRSAYKRKGAYMPSWLKDDAPEPKRPGTGDSGGLGRKLKPLL